MESSQKTYSIYQNNYKNCHCVLMANGPSLTKHDLSKIPKSLKVIGVNRSYEMVWPDFHCAIDLGQLRRTPGIYQQLAMQNRLFVPQWWPHGHRVPHCTEPIFSLDLAGTGAVTDIDGVGSAAFFALQVVVWLGFSRVYALGLDLGWVDGRSHFHDGPAQTPEMLARMNGLFTLAQPFLKKIGVEVLVTGSPRSKCTAFRKVPYPWK